MTSNSQYKIPTRNASVLGYGELRFDGRPAERRRPSPSRLRNTTLTAEAKAIPRGTGLNLTERQMMILCFLSPLERHQRATNVFNARGEWYRRYRHMTTLPNDRLAAVGIPRICVPRTASDRPTRRNLEQIELERAELARQLPGFAPSAYGRDQEGRAEITPSARVAQLMSSQRRVMSAPRRLAPKPLQNSLIAPPIPDLTFQMQVATDPYLIEPEAFQHLPPNAKDDPFFLVITLTLRTMGYEEVCDAILHTYSLAAGIRVPELYIGTLTIRWFDPKNGEHEYQHVFEHNWYDEIVPFMTSHPASQVAMTFGIAVAEESSEEAVIDPALCIDPALLV